MDTVHKMLLLEKKYKLIPRSSFSGVNTASGNSEGPLEIGEDLLVLAFR